MTAAAEWAVVGWFVGRMRVEVPAALRSRVGHTRAAMAVARVALLVVVEVTQAVVAGLVAGRPVVEADFRVVAVEVGLMVVVGPLAAGVVRARVVEELVQAAGAGTGSSSQTSTEVWVTA